MTSKVGALPTWTKYNIRRPALRTPAGYKYLSMMELRGDRPASRILFIPRRRGGSFASASLIPRRNPRYKNEAAIKAETRVRVSPYCYARRDAETMLN